MHHDRQGHNAGSLIDLCLGGLLEPSSTELQTLLEVFPIDLEQVEQLPLRGGRTTWLVEFGLQCGSQYFAAVQQLREKLRGSAAGHGVTDAKLARDPRQPSEAAGE